MILKKEQMRFFFSKTRGANGKRSPTWLSERSRGGTAQHMIQLPFFRATWYSFLWKKPRPQQTPHDKSPQPPLKACCVGRISCSANHVLNLLNASTKQTITWTTNFYIKKWCADSISLWKFPAKCRRIGYWEQTKVRPVTSGWQNPLLLILLAPSVCNSRFSRNQIIVNLIKFIQIVLYLWYTININRLSCDLILILFRDVNVGFFKFDQTWILKLLWDVNVSVFHKFGQIWNHLWR